jgi:hypothetical protein
VGFIRLEKYCGNFDGVLDSLDKDCIICGCEVQAGGWEGEVEFGLGKKGCGGVAGGGVREWGLGLCGNGLKQGVFMHLETGGWILDWESLWEEEGVGGWAE